jgi:tetratricopeptide (TPR) repeat protein
MRDLDFDCIVDSTAFLSAYRKAIKTIKDFEKKYGKTSYSMTLTGYAYVAYASFYVLHKKPFSAIGKGFEALDIFKELKKADSTNYDADFLLGFYDYGRGELKKRFWMILFWYPGSKKKGIRSLEACSVKGQITVLVAKMCLIDVYIQESEFQKSKKLSDSLFTIYPKSRFLLWSKAKYFEALKDYYKAAEVYGKLAELYKKLEYGDYNMLVTRLKQIKLVKKSGQKIEAEHIAKETAACKECLKNKQNMSICKDIKRYIKND